MFSLTKAIRSVDKRNSGFDGCLVVAIGVANVNSVLQVILVDDCADVVCFRFSGIARAEMSFKIAAKACCLQKNFTLACLTVAYDIKRIISGENRE